MKVNIYFPLSKPSQALVLWSVLGLSSLQLCYNGPDLGRGSKNQLWFQTKAAEDGDAEMAVKTDDKPTDEEKKEGDKVRVHN